MAKLHLFKSLIHRARLSSSKAIGTLIEMRMQKTFLRIYNVDMAKVRPFNFILRPADITT